MTACPPGSHREGSHRPRPASLHIGPHTCVTSPPGGWIKVKRRSLLQRITAVAGCPSTVPGLRRAAACLRDPSHRALLAWRLRTGGTLGCCVATRICVSSQGPMPCRSGRTAIGSSSTTTIGDFFRIDPQALRRWQPRDAHRIKVWRPCRGATSEAWDGCTGCRPACHARGPVPQPCLVSGLTPLQGLYR